MLKRLTPGECQLGLEEHSPKSPQTYLITTEQQAFADELAP